MARTVAGAWPVLSPLVYARRPGGNLPYPLGDPSCVVFSRARHGLHAGLTALGVGPGRVVLMPAWHHGSEVQAVREVGGECGFYPLDADLAPDPDGLRRLLTSRVKALHLTHYLGFPQDAARWRRWCDEQGIALVEDAAQSWLSTRDGAPVGSHGDLAVWCLYKTFGLPDGAALRGPAVPRPAAGRLALGPLARRHHAWLALRMPVAPSPRRRRYDPEADFALGVPAGPSPLTRWLLPRLVGEAARERRRVTYLRYLDVLGDLVPPPFRYLPPGTAPFAFPIAVHDKTAALAALGEAGVRAVELWSTAHPLLPPGTDQRADWLRAHLLALPVHQDLGRRWTRRIVTAAAGLLGVNPVSRSEPWAVVPS